MNKKLLALALTATMLLGASMTVFASNASLGTGGKDDKSGSKDVTGNVEYDGNLQPITISVEVSKAGSKVVMNPYKMVISELGGRTSVSDSMVLPDISFNNQTAVPVALGIAGYIDLSGNAATMTVVPGLNPLAPTTKKQVHVDVTFTADADGTNKLYSTAAAKTPDVATPYVAGTDTSALTTISIKNSPVLAKTGTTNDGSTTVYSDKVYLKFKGWCVSATGEQWPSDALVKVVTKYNISLADESKRSIFKP